jgi:Fe-S-cluster containining protein
VTTDAVVDCEGCQAPCCRRFAVWRQSSDGTQKEIPSSTVRRRWAAAGARLTKVGIAQPSGFTQFACLALTETSTCGVYETRPQICRIYDCRDDGSRFNPDAPAGSAPHCAWPR